MISLPSRGNVRQRTGKERKKKETRKERWSVVARHPRKTHRGPHADVGKEKERKRERERRREKATAHSATSTTRLGAELKARILPRRGAAALAPHKSSCFCLEQGGENRWNSPSFSLRLPRLYRRRAPRALARGYPVGTHERSCFFLPLLRASPPPAFFPV